MTPYKLKSSQPALLCVGDAMSKQAQYIIRSGTVTLFPAFGMKCQPLLHHLQLIYYLSHLQWPYWVSTLTFIELAIELLLPIFL